SVGGLVAEALPDLLARLDVPAAAAAVRELREQLIGVLSACDLPVRDSDANWVLVERPGLREALAPHGVLVRDCASFALPGWARIAVPGPDGLARVEAALSRALHRPALPAPEAGGER